MPDFRIKGTPQARRFPSEEYIQARTMAKGRSPEAEVVTSLLGGLEKGLTLTQTIGAMKEKKGKAERLAKLAETLGPAGKELGLPPEALRSAIESGQAGQLIQSIATLKKPVAKKQVDPYKQIRTEMLMEFKKNPKQFKDDYGEEGIAIIGGKSLGILEEMMKLQLQGKMGY